MAEGAPRLGRAVFTSDFVFFVSFVVQFSNDSA